MLIYGRYVEIVTPPLIAIGLALVAMRKNLIRTAVPLVAIAVFTIAVVAIRGLHVDPGEASR
jgi:MFS superfamily sulfate permease-like transporter